MNATARAIEILRGLKSSKRRLTIQSAGEIVARQLLSEGFSPDSLDLNAAFRGLYGAA
jgi:methionine salvage enolase-phosphatase E1